MKLSLEDQLLKSSLLCGLKSAGNPAYRLQLFFIANKELGSKAHQSDFQRAIETGVDKHYYWANYGSKGSGEYLITNRGFDIAKRRWGEISPIYQPIQGKDFHVLIKGEMPNLRIEIETVGNHKGSTTVRINDKCIESAKEACRIVEQSTSIPLYTRGESAVRVLYNFAIDHDFDLIWKGRNPPASGWRPGR